MLDMYMAMNVAVQRAFAWEFGFGFNRGQMGGEFAAACFGSQLWCLDCLLSSYLDHGSAMVWDDGKCILYIAFRLLDIITWMCVHVVVSTQMSYQCMQQPAATDIVSRLLSNQLHHVVQLKSDGRANGWRYTVTTARFNSLKELVWLKLILIPIRHTPCTHIPKQKDTEKDKSMNQSCTHVSSSPKR